MKLYGLDDMPAYDANLVDVLAFAMERSPYIDETKRRVIMDLIQRLVDVYVGKDSSQNAGGQE